MQFEASVSDVAGITLRLRSYSQVIHAANVRLPWGGSQRGLAPMALGLFEVAERRTRIGKRLSSREWFGKSLRDLAKDLLLEIEPRGAVPHPYGV